MMTETQEFLQALADPDAYKVANGVKNYIKEYMHIVHSVDIGEIETNTRIGRKWMITVLSDQESVIRNYAGLLPNYLIAHSDRLNIHKHEFHSEDKYCGLMFQAYTVWYK